MSGEDRVGATELRRDEQHRDRWSSVESRSGLVSISGRLSPAELGKLELFASYDADFLARLSPDVSVARWQEGAVLFEEGSYLDLAFAIVAGTVEVYLERLADPGHAAARRPIFDPGRTVYGKVPDDVLGGGTVPAPSRTVLAPPGPSSGITFLATLDFNLPRGGAVHLGPGEVLGEIGAMTGWPQAATARCRTPVEVIQLRLPALRALRRKSSAFKDRLDAAYRRFALDDQLASTPLLAAAPAELLQRIKTELELVSLEPGEEVCREGEAAVDLFVLRSGFLRISQKAGEGELSVNYLSKGMTLGEVELVAETATWTVTARAVEHAELIRVPAARARELLAARPELAAALWRSALDRVQESGAARRDLRRSEFLETALERGLVQGNALLVIDLESCTRCDDCVRACAATHDGRSRFVREGDKVGTLQVVHACYHCRDPVCLVGCPTGAIHRAGTGAVVAVDEDICIGCGACARACPYDAILMHPSGETWGPDMVPESLRGRERQVASKCDLCHTRPEGPACVSHCPNGCAHRVGSLEAFEELLWRR